MKAKKPYQPIDFDSLVREARMEHNVAIGNAIADGIVAVTRAFNFVIGKIASGLRTKHAEQHRT